jgi:ribonuclease HI
MTYVGGKLWFAPSLPDGTPGISFPEIDLSGKQLPQQFAQRIRGYYIEPAVDAATAGYTFASGLILVSSIDALAEIQTGNKRVGSRFRKWTAAELKSFKNPDVNKRFYEDFRDGLVHNARIKRGSQFSLDQNATVVYERSILSINPRLLADEVEDALSRLVTKLVTSDPLRDLFLSRIRSEFEEELGFSADQQSPFNDVASNEAAELCVGQPLKCVTLVCDGSSLGNGQTSSRAAAVALLGFKGVWRAVGAYLGQATNQQAEVAAAALGLESLREPCNVHLFTDSRYVVETMSGRFRRKTNHEWWARLDKAATRHQVKWEWTRGHAGNLVQEAADKAARRIAALGHVDEEILRAAIDKVGTTGAVVVEESGPNNFTVG